MVDPITDDPTQLFDELAGPLLGSGRADEGTMMGFPCLRTRGEFAAMADQRTGDLIVKLPADRVDALIDEGVGEPFAPAGRPFREWVLVTERDADRWAALLGEAVDFAGGAS